MRRTAAAAIGLSVLLGACSTSDTVERAIARAFANARNVKGLQVTCPGDAKSTKGAAFDCTLTGNELSTVSGNGTTQARIHVVFEQDNDFSVTSYTPVNGPSAGVTQTTGTGSSVTGTAS